MEGQFPVDDAVDDGLFIEAVCLYHGQRVGVELAGARRFVMINAGRADDDGDDDAAECRRYGKFHLSLLGKRYGRKGSRPKGLAFFAGAAAVLSQYYIFVRRESQESICKRPARPGEIFETKGGIFMI